MDGQYIVNTDTLIQRLGCIYELVMTYISEPLYN